MSKSTNKTKRKLIDDLKASTKCAKQDEPNSSKTVEPSSLEKIPKKGKMTKSKTDRMSNG